MSDHRLLEYRPNRWVRVDAETGAFVGLASSAEIRDWLRDRELPDDPASGASRPRVPWASAPQQVDVTAEAAVNALQAVVAGGLVLARPLVRRFPITSDFWAHKNRKPPSTMPGVDYGCPTGSEVRAWAGGRVFRSRWSQGGGRSLWIQHGKEIRTYYAHLNCVYVLEGETVSAGQKIGETGSTGRATGPHLHFSVLWRGQPLDPERFYPREEAVQV
jgi:murein DD-endopeptidase MepM/ murein hydrolase activator NlpD